MQKNIGYIHSIETGGTVDGPGIRYVIFFQMCPFRCKFCHNPDTWYKNPMGIRTLDNVVNDILKYKNFFNFSGGGITVSGGEPLLQSEFVFELFKKLKKDNIHCALDTCGYVDINDTIKGVIQNTDLVLLDIKHINTQIHKELTGKDNNKVIEFLNYLNNVNQKVWIRQVLVPTYTTDIVYIESLIKFLDKYRGIIEKVELLPYHTMGKEKWEKLGLKYQLDVEPPNKQVLQEIKDKFINSGYDVLIN